MVVFCFSLFAQEIPSRNSVNTTANDSPENLSLLQQQENEAFKGMFSDKKSSDNAEKNKNPSTFWLFFRTIFVLILVVIVIWAIFKFVKKTTGNNGSENDPYIKKVASLNLSAGKSVQVITIQNHCYVLGVADDSVGLIDILEYEKDKDKDLIDAMNFHKDSQPSEKVKDFASILASVMGIKKKDFQTASKESVLNLKSQVERLKKNSVENEKRENDEV